MDVTNMDVDVSQPASTEIIDSAIDTAERLEEERLVDAFWDEIEKLWQQEAELDQNDRFDDPYPYPHQSDKREFVDKFVSELAVDFPEHIVNPALETEISNALSQPAIDSSTLATDFVRENYQLFHLNGHDFRFDAQQEQNVASLAPLIEELQSLKSQLQQQQDLISKLQNQLNDLMASQQKNSEKLSGQLETEDVATVMASTLVHSENVRTCSVAVITKLPSHDSGQTNAEEPSGMPALQCNRKRIITRSYHKDPLDANQHSKSTALRPEKGNTEDDSSQSDGSSDQKQKRLKRNMKIDLVKRNVKSSGVTPGNTRKRKEKTYSCEVCNRRCVSNSKLIIHRRIHTGERPYKCIDCDASFSSKGNLTTHLRIHTGEKPFECGICKNSFRRRDHLSIHMNHHGGIKRLKCKLCKKTFGTRNVLSQHHKIHVEDKSFC